VVLLLEVEQIQAAEVGLVVRLDSVSPQDVGLPSLHAVDFSRILPPSLVFLGSLVDQVVEVPETRLLAAPY
jgi:hypothetical protein